MQREDLLHPSQFSLFKRSTELLIKIVLREREIWCNLSKISYLRHCIVDNRFPRFLLSYGNWGIFHSDIKDTKYLTIYQSICYKVFNNSRLSLDTLHALLSYTDRQLETLPKFTVERADTIRRYIESLGLRLGMTAESS